MKLRLRPRKVQKMHPQVLISWGRDSDPPDLSDLRPRAHNHLVATSGCIGLWSPSSGLGMSHFYFTVNCPVSSSFLAHFWWNVALSWFHVPLLSCESWKYILHKDKIPRITLEKLNLTFLQVTPSASCTIRLENLKKSCCGAQGCWTLRNGLSYHHCSPGPRVFQSSLALLHSFYCVRVIPLKYKSSPRN